MDDHTFNPGDVVQVRSGGPVMTVESIGSMVDNDSVNCVWFEKNKQMQGRFAAVALRKYRPAPGPRLIPLDSLMRRRTW